MQPSKDVNLRLIKDKIKQFFLTKIGKLDSKEFEKEPFTLKIEGTPYRLIGNNPHFIILEVDTPDKPENKLGKHDLKFHINVPDDRLADGWAIVAAACAQRKLSGMKATRAREGGDSEQAKKAITFYSPYKDTSEDIISLLVTIENEFVDENIPPLPENELPTFDAKLKYNKENFRFVTYRRNDDSRRSHYVPIENDKLENNFRISNVHIPDTENFRIPLHYAVINNRLAIVKQMLALQSNVRNKDDSGCIPLHYALDPNNFLIFEELIKTQPSKQMKARNLERQTPLHIAAQKNNLRAIQMLLELGADVNVVDIHGRTPLMHAIIGSNKPLIDAILNAKPNLHVRDRYNKSAMLYAAEKADFNLIEKLRNTGANELPATQMPMMSFIHYAAAAGKEDIIKSINNIQEVINFPDDRGNTPLHYAVTSGNVTLIEYLLKKGANTRVRNYEGQLPIHLAAKTCPVEGIKLVLGDHKKQLIAKDIHGKTPLHYAAENKPATISFLLNKGADRLMRDKHGRLPAHVAANKGLATNISALIANLPSGQVNSIMEARDTYGKVALHHAAESNQIEAAKLLLTLGSNIKVIDTKGKRPYYYAHGNPEMIQLLMVPDDIMHIQKHKYKLEPLVIAQSLNETDALSPPAKAAPKLS